MKIFCVLFLWIFIVAEGLSQSAICSYKYRKRITIDATKVSGTTDLTDFPVYINITSDNDLRTTANSGHVENANGFDIVFTSDDGVTLLSFEYVSYSASNGDFTCWVKVPTVHASVNTNIYMYYGNTSISSNQSSSSTWSNGYVGVWHLDNSLNNSTSTSGLNGTNNGSTNTATSKIGSARNFASASSQYVDVTPYNSAYDLTGAVTISGWIRLASTGADQKFAGNQNNSTGGWKFGVFSDNKIEMEIRTSSNAPFLSRSASGGTALSSGTFYHVAGVYSDAGDFINTYLNGALDRSLSTTAVLGSSNGTMKFAREPFASSAYLNGILDEVRLSNVVRSIDWIATEYNNQNSPSTFYSISSEPKIWDGSSSTAWNTNANWTPSGVPSAGGDVIIPAVTNQPVLNVSPSLSSIWIQNSATLSLSSRTLSIAYDITNCGLISGNTGYINMNGSSASLQDQSMGGSGTFNLTNLIINNTFPTAPSVTLNKDVNVSGVLQLTSGYVNTTATNILALGNSATSNAGSSSSFVSGPMSKSGVNAFVFPLGKGSTWARAGVSGITASTTFRAEYFDAPYTNTSSVNSPLTNVSVKEYWQVDRLVGSGNANLSLYWEDAARSGITSCSDLTIARFNGASWDERAGSTVAGSSCSTGTGTITTNAAVTAFSPFTFGSKTSGTVNPLPIVLSTFSAVCSDGVTDIEWTTASEHNNQEFVIESSADAMTWKEIARVDGAGNSNGPRSYSYTTRGEAGITYYRVVDVDVNGTSKYGPVVQSTCISARFNGMQLWPNPAHDAFVVSFGTSSRDESVLSISNSLGEVVYRQGVPAGVEAAEVFLDVPPGVYFVHLENDSAGQAEKLLIR